MASIIIQGINCTYRDLVDGEEILYSTLPKEEQIFTKVSDPFTDEDQLVEIAGLPFDERKTKYNKIQLQWAEQEEKRMTYGNGVYASINGTITYIPASYWGYINHWELEHGEKPEYREADRLFFLFMEYLYFETGVLGVTRGKGRRQGATSLGFYWTWWICGRLEDKIGGSISFNDEAATNNFQKMFMRGFKAMHPCFVRDFDSTADNFVRFVKPVEKAKKGVIRKRKGLNSYVDKQSNSINSYDSGRVSFLLPDETGKYEKMNINTYWSKVSPTLTVGRNKVGFAYMPTTVNPKNKGGANYRQFWNDANQMAINPETKEPYGLNTPHKVVRYLVPATEGYSGCIDKFGYSVVEDPLEPIMGNDGKIITEGAKTIILKDRALKKGEQLMEHRRDFPLDEYDMFAFETGQCEFNADNIQKQIRDIEAEPPYWRKMRLVQKKEKIKSPYKGTPDTIKISISPMDDEKGGWRILEYPNKENHFESYGDNSYAPLNKGMFQIGVDTTQDRLAENGSNPSIVVLKKSCIVTIDGQQAETGMYPVAIWDNPTRMDIHFDEEVLKACMWYGCTVAYEVDRRNDFLRYFRAKNCGEFLEWTSKIMMNPIKKKAPEPGYRSGDQFQLIQMLQICKWYIDGDSMDDYNGHVHRIGYIPLLEQLLEYNHSDRTKSDLVVGLQMALCAVFSEVKTMDTETPVISIFPEHKIKSYF